MKFKLLVANPPADSLECSDRFAAMIHLERPRSTLSRSGSACQRSGLVALEPLGFSLTARRHSVFVIGSHISLIRFKKNAVLVSATAASLLFGVSGFRHLAGPRRASSRRPRVTSGLRWPCICYKMGTYIQQTRHAVRREMAQGSARKLISNSTP